MLSRKLRWTLGVTLVLTAIALLTPDERQVDRLELEQIEARAASRSVADAGSEPPPPLPLDLERQTFSPPERDPFTAIATPLPVAAPSPAVSAAPVPPPPPPPPPPPAFTARYLAQLQTPSGERVLYFQDDDRLVVAQVGATLSGYVIDGLLRAGVKGGPATKPVGGNTGEGDIVAVEVVHPATSHRQVVHIPAVHP
jgi:hypothetical protein